MDVPINEFFAELCHVNWIDSTIFRYNYCANTYWMSTCRQSTRKYKQTFRSLNVHMVIKQKGTQAIKWCLILHFSKKKRKKYSHMSLSLPLTCRLYEDFSCDTDGYGEGQFKRFKGIHLFTSWYLSLRIGVFIRSVWGPISLSRR